MKTSLLTTMLAICLLASNNTNAQFEYSDKEHLAIGVFIDGMATLDHNNITGKVSPDFGVDLVFTSRILNIKVSSEWFPALNDYRDVMGTVGLNFQAGMWDQWQFTGGVKTGMAWRRHYSDEKFAFRPQLGFEGSVVYWANSNIGFSITSNIIKARHQEIRGYTAENVLSTQIGVRFCVSNNKPRF